MGNGELYNWVESPEALDNVTFVKLEENLKEYPYFQTLRLLYQKSANFTTSTFFKRIG